MKILQINKYFYKKGGAETVFFNTIDLLTRKGHTVVPFTLKNKKNLPSPYASYFVDYPELSESGLWTKLRNLPSFIYNKEAARKLEELLIAEKPDIAHIHLMFNSMSVSILPVLRKYNIPVVMSVHDYRLVCPAYTFVDGKGHFCERCKNGAYYNCMLYRCSNRNLFNSVMLSLDSYYRGKYIRPMDYMNRFIFVSQFSRQKHIYINPAFENRSTYLYNFTPAVRETSTGKGDYLFFFGRISEEKGIVTLLNAIKQLPDVQLILAGTGPLLEEMKEKAPINAQFVGFKQGEELQALVRNASFVLVPSETYENNPMTIIESYTLGTPVIGSDLGGIPELIEVGKTGFVFTPKSSESLSQTIRQALAISEAEYAAMSEAAKQFSADNFSEEAHYFKLMQIYDSVVKQR